MKSVFTLILFACCSFAVQAQVTLTPWAPDDSFDLACPTCTLIVSDLSLIKGQQALPVDLRKPLATNLLHWRSFDNVLERNVVTDYRPTWRESTQLVDEVSDAELLSLHINLDWADSTGRSKRILLVVSGLTKPDLGEQPLECSYDEDPYLSRRFSALVQIHNAPNQIETYDCIMGFCILENLDLKTGALSGSFEFTGNRIGFKKRGFFSAGRFRR